jgi:hypothetical protein
VLLVLLCASARVNHFLFPTSAPLDITGSVTKGNILRGNGTCSEGHENDKYVSPRIRADKKPLELLYLQFHIYCLTAHSRDM